MQRQTKMTERFDVTVMRNSRDIYTYLIAHHEPLTDTCLLVDDEVYRAVSMFHSGDIQHVVIKMRDEDKYAYILRHKVLRKVATLYEQDDDEDDKEEAKYTRVIDTDFMSSYEPPFDLVFTDTYDEIIRFAAKRYCDVWQLPM
jgi:hypothetical protein